MKVLKLLFKPLQPSVENYKSNQVSYVEIQPDATIKNFVYCYWELKSKTELKEPFKYRVVSDGCVDILINLQDGSDFITGFSKQYLEYELGTSFHYIGIRFYPFMFPLLFGISASSLVGKFLSLNEVLPAFSKILSKHIQPYKTLEEFTITFNELLNEAIFSRNPKQELDIRFTAAVEQILTSGGNISINNLDIALSERQLRRQFQFYFGESPKVFAKVFRFQNILNAKPSLQSLKTDKIFYDKGYFDQAHFIRNFKCFYGVTPSKAFGRE